MFTVRLTKDMTEWSSSFKHLGVKMQAYCILTLGAHASILNLILVIDRRKFFSVTVF